MPRAITLIVIELFALASSIWAVPNIGAAHSVFSGEPRGLTQRSVPSLVQVREDKNRGLLVKVWINGRGPFTAAIDTGAGLSIVSESLARTIGLQTTPGRATVLTGLSGRQVTARHSTIQRVAVGEPYNEMPSRLECVIGPPLPADIDAVLDPTDLYSPLGYSIDFPKRLISAFDPQNNGLNRNQPPRDGAIVPWLRDNLSNRPYVQLGDGRRALIDTGSAFGLAINASLVSNREDSKSVSPKDLGGGSFKATRVKPTNVSIGALVLEQIPTDILSGVESGVPVILGRDALYPFKLSFDPLRRLIEIAPSVQDR
jgi:Aspartyl protease